MPKIMNTNVFLYTYHTPQNLIPNTSNMRVACIRPLKTIYGLRAQGTHCYGYYTIYAYIVMIICSVKILNHFIRVKELLQCLIGTEEHK